MADVRERAGDMMMKAKRRVGIENPSAADDDGNVGIVRGALRAFGEGDFDKFLDALHEDVTWEAPGNNFPGGAQLSGRQEVRDNFIDNCGRTFTTFGFIPESYLDAADENAVVVFGDYKGDGADGGSVEASAVQVWQFKGTEAELVRIYTDTADFPEVITEQKQKEREEQERKEKEEQEKKEAEAEKEDSESDDEEDGEKSESKSDESSESKSEDQTDAKKDDDSESKSDDDSESKSESSSESKSDESSESKSDSDDDGDDSEKSS